MQRLDLERIVFRTHGRKGLTELFQIADHLLKTQGSDSDKLILLLFYLRCRTANNPKIYRDFVCKWGIEYRNSDVVLVKTFKGEHEFINAGKFINEQKNAFSFQFLLKQMLYIEFTYYFGWCEHDWTMTQTCFGYYLDDYAERSKRYLIQIIPYGQRSLGTEDYLRSLCMINSSFFDIPAVLPDYYLQQIAV